MSAANSNSRRVAPSITKESSYDSASYPQQHHPYNTNTNNRGASSSSSLPLPTGTTTATTSRNASPYYEAFLAGTSGGRGRGGAPPQQLSEVAAVGSGRQAMATSPATRGGGGNDLNAANLATLQQSPFPRNPMTAGAGRGGGNTAGGGAGAQRQQHTMQPPQPSPSPPMRKYFEDRRSSPSPSPPASPIPAAGREGEVHVDAETTGGHLHHSSSRQQQQPYDAALSSAITIDLNERLSPLMPPPMHGSPDTSPHHHHDTHRPEYRPTLPAAAPLATYGSSTNPNSSVSSATNSRQQQRKQTITPRFDTYLIPSTPKRGSDQHQQRMGGGGGGSFNSSEGGGRRTSSAAAAAAAVPLPTAAPTAYSYGRATAPVMVSAPRQPHHDHYRVPSSCAAVDSEEEEEDVLHTFDFGNEKDVFENENKKYFVDDAPSSSTASQQPAVSATNNKYMYANPLSRKGNNDGSGTNALYHYPQQQRQYGSSSPTSVPMYSPAESTQASPFVAAAAHPLPTTTTVRAPPPPSPPRSSNRGADVVAATTASEREQQQHGGGGGGGRRDEDSNARTATSAALSRPHRGRNKAADAYEAGFSLGDRRDIVRTRSDISRTMLLASASSSHAAAAPPIPSGRVEGDDYHSDEQQYWNTTGRSDRPRQQPTTSSASSVATPLARRRAHDHSRDGSWDDAGGQRIRRAAENRKGSPSPSPNRRDHHEHRGNGNDGIVDDDYSTADVRHHWKNNANASTASASGIALNRTALPPNVAEEPTHSIAKECALLDMAMRRNQRTLELLAEQEKEQQQQQHTAARAERGRGGGTTPFLHASSSAVGGGIHSVSPIRRNHQHASTHQRHHHDDDDGDYYFDFNDDSDDHKAARRSPLRNRGEAPAKASSSSSAPQNTNASSAPSNTRNNTPGSASTPHHRSDASASLAAELRALAKPLVAMDGTLFPSSVVTAGGEEGGTQKTAAGSTMNNRSVVVAAAQSNSQLTPPRASAVGDSHGMLLMAAGGGGTSTVGKRRDDDVRAAMNELLLLTARSLDRHFGCPEHWRNLKKQDGADVDAEGKKKGSAHSAHGAGVLPSSSSSSGALPPRPSTATTTAPSTAHAQQLRSAAAARTPSPARRGGGGGADASSGMNSTPNYSKPVSAAAVPSTRSPTDPTTSSHPRQQHHPMGEGMQQQRTRASPADLILGLLPDAAPAISRGRDDDGDEKEREAERERIAYRELIRNNGKQPTPQGQQEGEKRKTTIHGSEGEDDGRKEQRKEGATNTNIVPIRYHYQQPLFGSAGVAPPSTANMSRRHASPSIASTASSTAAPAINYPPPRQQPSPSTKRRNSGSSQQMMREKGRELPPSPPLTTSVPVTSQRPTALKAKGSDANVNSGAVDKEEEGGGDDDDYGYRGPRICHRNIRREDRPPLTANNNSSNKATAPNSSEKRIHSSSTVACGPDADDENAAPPESTVERSPSVAAPAAAAAAAAAVPTHHSTYSLPQQPKPQSLMASVTSTNVHSPNVLSTHPSTLRQEHLTTRGAVRGRDAEAMAAPTNQRPLPPPPAPAPRRVLDEAKEEEGEEGGGGDVGRGGGIIGRRRSIPDPHTVGAGAGEKRPQPNDNVLVMTAPSKPVGVEQGNEGNQNDATVARGRARALAAEAAPTPPPLLRTSSAPALVVLTSDDGVNQSRAPSADNKEEDCAPHHQDEHRHNDGSVESPPRSFDNATDGEEEKKDELREHCSSDDDDDDNTNTVITITNPAGTPAAGEEGSNAMVISVANPSPSRDLGPLMENKDSTKPNAKKSNASAATGRPRRNSNGGNTITVIINQMGHSQPPIGIAESAAAPPQPSSAQHLLTAPPTPLPPPAHSSRPPLAQPPQQQHSINNTPRPHQGASTSDANGGGSPSPSRYRHDPNSSSSPYYYPHRGAGEGGRGDANADFYPSPDDLSSFYRDDGGDGDLLIQLLAMLKSQKAQHDKEFVELSATVAVLRERRALSLEAAAARQSRSRSGSLLAGSSYVPPALTYNNGSHDDHPSSSRYLAPRSTTASAARAYSASPTPEGYDMLYPPQAIDTTTTSYVPTTATNTARSSVNPPPHHRGDDDDAPLPPPRANSSDSGIAQPAAPQPPSPATHSPPSRPHSASSTPRKGEEEEGGTADSEQEDDEGEEGGGNDSPGGSTTAPLPTLTATPQEEEEGPVQTEREPSDDKEEEEDGNRNAGPHACLPPAAHSRSPPVAASAFTEHVEETGEEGDEAAFVSEDCTDDANPTGDAMGEGAASILDADAIGAEPIAAKEDEKKQDEDEDEAESLSETGLLPLDAIAATSVHTTSPLLSTTTPTTPRGVAESVSVSGGNDYDLYQSCESTPQWGQQQGPSSINNNGGGGGGGRRPSPIHIPSAATSVSGATPTAAAKGVGGSLSPSSYPRHQEFGGGRNSTSVSSSKSPSVSRSPYAAYRQQSPLANNNTTSNTSNASTPTRAYEFGRGVRHKKPPTSEWF